MRSTNGAAVASATERAQVDNRRVTIGRPHRRLVYVKTTTVLVFVRVYNCISFKNLDFFTLLHRARVALHSAATARSYIVDLWTQFTTSGALRDS